MNTTRINISDIAVPARRMRVLRDEVVNQLAELIQGCGLLEPILVSPDGGGYTLMAGRHRLAAAKKLGHDQICALSVDGIDGDRRALIEIDENLIRADLSPAERALHLAERKRLYLKNHPDTESVRVRGGPGRGHKNESQNENGFPAFIDDTAAKTGKGRSTIAREVARAKIADIADAIGTTLDQGDELDALVRLPEATQRDLITRAKAGEKLKVSVALKKANRARREQELADATQRAAGTLGQKLYGVLYADPPWRYSSPPMGDVARANEQHYPTMEVADIAALSVPAADDCVLFLWATIPMLVQALAVMAACGFTYKSAIVWEKDRAGTGYWVRGQCELLLIAVRGQVPAPSPGEQPPAKIEAPRGRHSEKPEVLAEHIERLFPNVPKLEMFARKARPGWDVWGNEIPRQQLREGV